MSIKMTWPMHQRQQARRSDGAIVHLTPAERDMLAIFLLNKLRPLSKYEVIERMWPNPDFEPEYVEQVFNTHLCRLRQKLALRSAQLGGRNGNGWRYELLD